MHGLGPATQLKTWADGPVGIILSEVEKKAFSQFKTDSDRQHFIEHLLLAKIYLKSQNFSAVTTQLETYLTENPTGPVADEVRKNMKNLPAHP